MKFILSIVTLTAIVIVLPVANSLRFICYFPNWTAYRAGEGKFGVEDIDSSLCTHYIYSFAKLNDATQDAIEPFDVWMDIQLEGYKRFVALKEKNPELKMMIAIGGWAESLTDKYSVLVASSEKIAKFVDSVVSFLQLYGFDGLDVDWEFPYKEPTDKQGFTNLVTALKTAFQPHGFLLSAAMPVNTTIIKAGYDLTQVKNQVDFLNIMAYDMHGPWEDYVDNHAPLKKRDWEPEDYFNNVDYIMNYYIQQRVPMDKLNMGIPLYGKTWTLNSEETTWGASASGPGLQGPYTAEPGTLSYCEICSYVKNDRWTVVQDPDLKAGPYAYSPLSARQYWAGYDDIGMVSVKTQYALDLSIGGVMVWELSNDDFNNLCGDGRNPLLHSIYRTIPAKNKL